jgi:5-methylcytosine-specific restriction endonuclease McrA
MAKLGKCPDCPQGARDVLLIGGKCQHHHFNGGKVERTNMKEVAAIAKDVKKSLSAWYAEQEKQIPKLCENCKKRISIPAELPRKTAICHIVPKRNVKSVQTHPLNRWFGCWQCHTDFDNKSEGDVASMPVAALCRARIKEFYDLIPQKERKYVPEWLVKNNVTV